MRRGRKWEYTRGIVDSWLRYLPIQQCALVIFDDQVKVFPKAGGYLDVNGAEGPRNLDQLLSVLAKVQPSGNTNTLEAVRTAYALNPTAILLATDGFPDHGTNRFDFQMADQVIELCRSHADAVPVHIPNWQQHSGRLT